VSGKFVAAFHTLDDPPASRHGCRALRDTIFEAKFPRLELADCCTCRYQVDQGSHYMNERMGAQAFRPAVLIADILA
jgi:hypothetical protein